MDLRRDKVSLVNTVAWISGATGVHKHRDRWEQPDTPWDVRGAWRLFAPTATPDGACQPGETGAEEEECGGFGHCLKIRLHL